MRLVAVATVRGAAQNFAAHSLLFLSFFLSRPNAMKNRVNFVLVGCLLHKIATLKQQTTLSSFDVSVLDLIVQLYIYE